MIKIKKSTRRKVENKGLWWYIATWFGCGQAPFASGTFGSLGALPFAYIIQSQLGSMALFIASLLIFAAGCWASNAYLRHTNRVDDASEIVVDEVAGQWLLLAALFPTWQAYLLGFLLFRIFDVIKPWPVSLADRKIKGGVGVMVDDMLAGLYPILLFLALQAIAPQFATPLLDFLRGTNV